MRTTFIFCPTRFALRPRQHSASDFTTATLFPDSEVAPTIERLKDAQLRTRSRVVPVQGLRVVGKRAVGTVRPSVPEESGNLILSVHTAPNFIELAPDKFLGYLEEEGLTKVIEWRAEHGEGKKPGRKRYSKFAKSLVTFRSSR